IVANHLVDSVYFRPSQATRLRNHLKQLSSSERNLVALINKDHQLPSAQATVALSPRQRAAVLETAYELIRYRTQNDKLSRKATADLSYALLRARSKIPEESGLLPLTTPRIRDDQGHPTARITATAGRYNHRNYLDLALRPAYHSFSDPSPGYRPGSQLQFLNTELRYYLDGDELELEQLNVVDIISLS